MIVPPSKLPPATPPGLMQDNEPTQMPSQALLLMAAAGMHQQGKLRSHGASAKAGAKIAARGPDSDETA